MVEIYIENVVHKLSKCLKLVTVKVSEFVHLLHSPSGDHGIDSSGSEWDLRPNSVTSITCKQQSRPSSAVSHQTGGAATTQLKEEAEEDQEQRGETVGTHTPDGTVVTRAVRGKLEHQVRKANCFVGTSCLPASAFSSGSRTKMTCTSSHDTTST